MQTQKAQDELHQNEKANQVRYYDSESRKCVAQRWGFPKGSFPKEDGSSILPDTQEC